MKQFLHGVLSLAFLLFCSATSVFAMGGGGGGCSGTSLDCNTPVTESGPGNETGNTPSTTTCLNGPGYYTGSDIDGDGCEDIEYSVENGRFYCFTAPLSGCVTYDLSITTSTQGDLNLQTSWFPDVSNGNSCGCTGLDGGNGVHHTSSPGGDGNDYTLSMTICNGETTTIFTDGYAGDDDGGYIIEVQCPLPIELISFTGQLEENGIQLDWQTATETSNDHFVVQRSSDAHVFKDIATIEGSGNTKTTTAYTYFDDQPLTGTNYYRLKQVDEGGEQYSISEVIAIQRDNGNSSNLHVNQFFVNAQQGVLKTRFVTDVAADMNVRIYNLTGQQVESKKIATVQGHNEVNMNIDQLPKGLFFIAIFHNGKPLYTDKFTSY